MIDLISVLPKNIQKAPNKKLCEKAPDLNIPNDSFKIKNLKSQNKDKSNNRKFDVTECAKNFMKGVLSPVTAVLKHPIATVGVVATTAVACNLIPVLGPITAIGFGALSAFQLGKGVYNTVKNYKNGEYDKAEKSFEQVGQGAVGTAMSFIGIKQNAKVAQEAKLMSELKTTTLSLEQKAKIASEIENGTTLNALKEIGSLFTSKAGLKSIAAQFKPSNVLSRGKDAINFIKLSKSFEKTAEGKRRAALSPEEIDKEIQSLSKEVFDECGIPEELRPEIKVFREKDIMKGGGYNSQTHTIRVNEEAYRKGCFDLPNTIRHEAHHTQEALLRSTLPQEAKEELLQEYLLSKIANGDNNTVIYEGGFLGTSTMKPPKLNEQMKIDFTNFVKNEIYGKNTSYSKEELCKMIRPFVESNKEFCAAFNSVDDATNTMAKYAQSHQIRYNAFMNSVNSNVKSELLQKLKNVNVEEAQESCKRAFECLDGNSSNQTFGQKIGLGGGDFDQYQFGLEEVTAQQKGNGFEISKLEQQLESLRANTSYDTNQEAYLLNQIEIAKGTIRYKTLGREYYGLQRQLKANPNNKELAAKVNSMKKELTYLKRRIEPVIFKDTKENVKIINRYVSNPAQGYPPNATIATDIILGNGQEE